MVIISDDANPLAVADGARAANNLDPAAALSLFDVVHGTTATADVGAGTTPWWSSPPPYCAGSAVPASSSFPPLQSHGNDLACYGGSIMDTSFPQLPAHMQPELSYFYCPQQQGFPSPFVLEPNAIRPQLQVPTTSQPASMPLLPSLQYYPQTQATATGSASVEEASSPALADRQQAQQDDTSRSAPRRRGRPPKRALAVSEPPPPVSKPTKRVAVGTNRAASSSSEKTSSAATGSATMSSAAGQVVPDQAGASSSSTGSTSGQHTAACTSANRPMAAALLCEERCQLQRPALSNGAPAGAVVDEGHHQQAATAPPELTMVTGLPQYADTSAVGVRFHPTDQELIGYLRMKHARQQQMPVKFFKEFDVYQAHPMAIKGACGESQNGCWYAFSRRDRRYRNGQRPARSVFVEGGGGQQQQVGFWKSNSKLSVVKAGGRKNGAVIGRMTTLTFHLGWQPRGTQTGWKMREYTIPENQHQPDGSAMLLNDWVVCKLFYKEKRPKCTKAERKTDENGTVGQEQAMHGKSEEDKSGTSVGQKRPRRGRKSKNATPVAVGEAAGESVRGEEDMQLQMVPAAAHQASDYSEKADLCVEDYLVCDVEFVQQNDAANCTI